MHDAAVAGRLQGSRLRPSAPDASSRSRIGEWLLAAVGWGVVIVCCGLPLGWLVGQVLLHPSMLGEVRLSSFRAGLLGRTILYNVAVAGVATILALPAALVIGRGRAWAAAILGFALPVTLLLPSISYAYGWSQSLRLLNADPFPQSGADVVRCIWTLATWLWALPAGIIGLSLRRMDPQVQQQALLDGVLWRVTLRQLAGPVVASGAIVSVLAMQEFAVYEPTGISVVATEVRTVFETGSLGSPGNPIAAVTAEGGWQLGAQTARSAAAVATAIPLLLVIALLAGMAAWAIRRDVAAGEEVAHGAWPAVLRSGWWAVLLSAVVVAVSVGVPTVSMVLSLHRKFDPVHTWTALGPQLAGSLLVSAAAGAVALGVAFAATVRPGRWMLPLAIVAFLVGGQLLAIAQIRLYNRPWLQWVYNAAPIVVLAFLSRFVWVALLAARATWQKPWRQVRELAALDGAGPLRTAWHVVWPLAWPLCAAAGVLVMILSLTEVPAAVLLAPQDPPLLIPMLMQWVHMQRYDAMLEGSLLLMAMVMVLALGAVGLVWGGMRFVRWGRGGPSGQPLRGVASVLVVGVVLVVQGCGRGGKPEAVWCSTGVDKGQVVYPRAITYSPGDDTFFVVDRMARIQHLDRAGRFISEVQMPQWERGKPVGLTVGLDGLLYVPDTHYQRVVVYDPKTWRQVREWGSFGTGPGQFIYPTDVAFDAKGRIFVSEYGDNDRIQVFDREGKFLYQFGKFGTGDGEFCRPQSMLIEGELVYVTDACNHRLVVFTTEGKFVRNMGQAGSGLGQFRYPYGLDMDREGRLVVCEFGNNRVQLVDKQTGRGIEAWGTGGREEGQLGYPWGVAVDKRDRVVVVDAGNNRLQVFGF